jgi:hypothetical protein
MSDEFLAAAPGTPACAGDADSAVPAGAEPDVVRPVFHDPTGRRRAFLRISAATLAAASIAFITGAGLLLAERPMTSSPNDIEDGGTGQRAALSGPVAGAANEQYPIAALPPAWLPAANLKTAVPATTVAPGWARATAQPGTSQEPVSQGGSTGAPSGARPAAPAVSVRTIPAAVALTSTPVVPAGSRPTETPVPSPEPSVPRPVVVE